MATGKSSKRRRFQIPSKGYHPTGGGVSVELTSRRSVLQLIACLYLVSSSSDSHLKPSSSFPELRQPKTSLLMHLLFLRWRQNVSPRSSLMPSIPALRAVHTLNGSLVGIATSSFPDGAEGFPRIFPEGEAPTSNKGIDWYMASHGFLSIFFVCLHYSTIHLL